LLEQREPVHAVVVPPRALSFSSAGSGVSM
jgi:hypothetical protein